MIQNLIYIIPVVALIAMLWSSRNAIRNMIKKLFPAKEKITLDTKSEFSKIINKSYILFVLSFLLSTNHGKKQEETVFEDRGKNNSQSESYKNIQINVFKTE